MTIIDMKWRIFHGNSLNYFVLLHLTLSNCIRKYDAYCVIVVHFIYIPYCDSVSTWCTFATALDNGYRGRDASMQ
jgi:hypothetical protein